MDASHFRQRAAQAREMAQSGDDIRLSQMLLEVAADMDVEAAVIEAEEAARGRGFHDLRSRRMLRNGRSSTRHDDANQASDLGLVGD